MYAASEDCVFILASHSEESVNCVNARGETPLHLAAQFGRVGCAEQLLLHGLADLEAASALGETPLLAACRRCSFSVAELLLRRGARADARDADGVTALHHACNSQRMLLRIRDVCVLILLGAGAPANAACARGETPLDLAEAHGLRNVATILLGHGATRRSAPHSLAAGAAGLFSPPSPS